MFEKLPIIKVPDLLVQLCQVEMRETQKCHREVIDLVQQDSFANMLSKQSLQAKGEDLKKTELYYLLNHYGVKFVRNHLAAAYLFHATYKEFPRKRVLEESKAILDFEIKFESILTSSNSRVFLLGLYLRLCEIELGLKPGVILDQDEKILSILSMGKSKPEKPDWLIVFLMILLDKVGEDKLQQMIRQGKGKLSSIWSSFKSEDFNLCINGLLKYGNAISDEEFFLYNKV